MSETWLINDDVKSDHLDEVVFVKFLSCKITLGFPSFWKEERGFFISKSLSIAPSRLQGRELGALY
jgi:hypothetical protein